MESFNVTLASTLLEIELQHEHGQGHHQDKQTDKFDRPRTGIKSLDRGLPQSLWRGGKIIGIGHVGEDESGVYDDHNDDDLAVELIVTHLLNRRQDHVPDKVKKGQLRPSVYLLAPPSSTTVSSIYSRLHDRLKRKSRPPTRSRPSSKRSISAYVNQTKQGSNTSANEPSKSSNISNPDDIADNNTKDDIETQAMGLLERVSVLQYLDLVGLSESLSEISTLLSSNTVITNNTNTNTTTDTDHNKTKKTTRELDQGCDTGDVIVYIEGLPKTLSHIITRIASTSGGGGSGGGTGVNTHTNSRTSQSAALFTNVMRNIRLLCKTRLSPSPSTTIQTTQSTALRRSSQITILLGLDVSLVKNSRTSTRSIKEETTFLRTAFADEKGRCPRLQISTSAFTSSTSTSTSTPSHHTTTRNVNTAAYNAEMILTCILESAIDSILLIHDGFKSDLQDPNQQLKIVEVVKNTTRSSTGGNTGSWAVWS